MYGPAANAHTAKTAVRSATATVEIDKFFIIILSAKAITRVALV
jgi:hypothetical protein